MILGTIIFSDRRTLPIVADIFHERECRLDYFMEMDVWRQKRDILPVMLLVPANHEQCVYSFNFIWLNNLILSKINSQRKYSKISVNWGPLLLHQREYWTMNGNFIILFAKRSMCMKPPCSVCRWSVREVGVVYWYVRLVWVKNVMLLHPSIIITPQYKPNIIHICDENYAPKSCIERGFYIIWPQNANRVLLVVWLYVSK